LDGSHLLRHVTHMSLRLEILNTTDGPIIFGGDIVKDVLNICIELVKMISGLFLRIWKLVRQNWQVFVGRLLLHLLLDLLLIVWQHVYQILNLLLLIDRLFVCII